MTNQGLALFKTWLKENEEEITEVMIGALKHIEGVAGALTDAEGAGWDATRTRIQGLVTANSTVFSDKIRANFEEHFARRGFLDALTEQGETIARENVAKYIDVLIERAGIRRPVRA